MHELLLVALERLAVPCIFNQKLPSSFIDKVDIFVLEMVLRGFVICLNTEGAHGDFRGRTALAPYTKKKVISPVARLVMSCYLTVSMEAHQSTFFHASSSHHNCES
jgi:hypothetical protein